MAGEKFYTILAKYYDKVYHFIDYPKQAAYFVKLIKRFGRPKGRKILDICCGTGTHLSLLSKKGFCVTGCDESREMLKQARQKYPHIRFFQCDMQELDLVESFDVIICFFNSILYSYDSKRMRVTLSKFYKQLNKRGILIFDMVDKRIGVDSKKEEYIYEDDEMKITFSPQWVYDENKGGILDLNVWFTIEKNGSKEEIFDYHRMGAFTFDEVKSILREIGFEVFILEHDFDRIAKLDPDRTRATFVARRK